mmetsp:Transcript_9648/g.41485  ORF Transcript_9648/g.41485 Transcript_9648/m.41485 type:complete len:260 (+) Transcript_9648:317-1096(+)
MGPATYGPKEAVGAPDHPHRGQETITYILKGQMQHLDSHGHAGNLNPGDVQWMTAGAGVVHSEMPGDELFEKGGTLEGFQMWVNLPKEKKMTKPRYQELKSTEIPSSKSDDGQITVKVLAGKFKDTKAHIDTVTPIVYYDVFAEKSGEVSFDPGVKRLFVYVYRGKAQVCGRDMEEGEIAVLETEEGDVEVLSANEGCGCLVFGGDPLNQPVAWVGPFVMTTQEEIRQAMIDYQTGILGSIPGSDKRYEQTRIANQNRS